MCGVCNFGSCWFTVLQARIRPTWDPNAVTGHECGRPCGFTAKSRMLDFRPAKTKTCRSVAPNRQQHGAGKRGRKKSFTTKSSKLNFATLSVSWACGALNRAAQTRWFHRISFMFPFENFAQLHFFLDDSVPYFLLCLCRRHGYIPYGCSFVFVCLFFIVLRRLAA